MSDRGAFRRGFRLTREKRTDDPVLRRMRERRQERGLSYQRLGAMIGIAPSHVFHIENGDKVPAEDVVVRIARALHDDPEIYRAWVRIVGRSGLRDSLEALRVLNERAGPELVKELAEGHIAPGMVAAVEIPVRDAPQTLERAALAAAGSDVLPAPASLGGEARLLSLAHRAPWTPGGDPTFRVVEQGAHGPARVVVPVVPAGVDPGPGPRPPLIADWLRLDPARLETIGSLRHPFALPLTAALVRRVSDLLPDSGFAVVSRDAGPLAPAEVYAVRLEGVALARLLWNGAELVVLPAPSASDFVVLPAAGEQRLRDIVAGRVVAVALGA